MAAQAHVGNVGQDDACVVGAVIAVADLQALRLRVRVEEVGVVHEGFVHQHMRQSVLHASIKAERVACVKGHGFASARQRDMQGAVRVFRHAVDQLCDEVGGDAVVVGGFGVADELAFGVGDDVDVFQRELHVFKAEILAELRKPALAAGYAEQGDAGGFRPCRRRDQMDFGGNERRIAVDGEFVQGFGGDLRGQPGHDQQDAAGMGMWLTGWVHVLAPDVQDRISVTTAQPFCVRPAWA